jgi:hypothetical protein
VGQSVAVRLLWYLARLFKLRASLPRSALAVADILRQFKVGESTGFLQDDFVHIPISDPALERIRDKFERLAESHPEWAPQAPFPLAATNELEAFIAEAEALAVLGAVERVKIGQLAEDYLDGRVPFSDFMRAMPDPPPGEDVAELIDLIEHEPKRGGFGGASPEEYDRHMERIRELARSLRRPEAAG